MKKSIIIVSLALLLVISIFFDVQIAQSVSKLHTPLLIDFMRLISFIADPISISIICILLFAIPKKKREYLPIMALTLLLSTIITYGLKFLVLRPRPNFLDILHLDSYSFPSGHALFVFVPLVLISKNYPKLKWIWLGLAVLTILSRVYLGVHFPSDVIGGALLGYLLGIGVLYAYKGEIA